MDQDKPVIIETGGDVDACIIWLHGLGADANDFVPIVPELGLPDSLHARFIFPNAPIIPITINQGYRMPGWYDITSVEVVDRDEDRVGIERSGRYIAGLIDEQLALGIDAGRIIVAGFSQGGVVALHVGLNHSPCPGGVLALSCYLPECAAVDASRNKDIDIFMAHGDMDSVIDIKYAKTSLKLLKEQGFVVNWHEYEMGHGVCPQQVIDIGQWLKAHLC